MRKRTYDNYDYEEAYQVELEKGLRKRAFARFKEKTTEEMGDWPGYDYEKAYQEQNEKLEEAELERLLNSDTVKCLYKTTTNKATNLQSGATLLEAQIYPSFKYKTDMPKTKLKRETRPSQKNINDKNARRYLIRLANINFGKGDIWATFGWDDEHVPEDMDKAQKDVRNFIKKINYRRKKAGLDNIKYIYIIAADENTRPHFHILLSGDHMDRDELESLWTKCDRKNTKRLEPDENFLLSGLATYISNNPHGSKRWCPSKNLVKPPKPTHSLSKFKKRNVQRMVADYEFLKSQMEKAYPGFKFLDAEVKYNGVNDAFYIYSRMVRN